MGRAPLHNLPSIVRDVKETEEEEAEEEETEPLLRRESWPAGRLQEDKPPPQTPRDEYRPDIDGLRAVAVTCVVLYHMNNAWIPGGFIGVDIFFVISGFVVTGSLLRRPSPSMSEYFAGFYARRLKRLAPALIAVVFSTGLMMALWIPPWIPQLPTFYMSGMLSLVGWSNNYFAAAEHGYFDVAPDTHKNPFTHTWSLAVEEQFYFVFPLLVLLAHGPRAVKTAPSPPWWLPQRHLFVLAACCSLVVSALLAQYKATFAFYLMPSRFWELMAGALTYEMVASEEWGAIARDKAVIATLESLAIILIGIALVFTPNDSHFPFPWAGVAVAGTACYIAAGTSPRARLNACLSCSAPVYVGKVSYAIYLWHWPVLIMLDWALNVTISSILQAACLLLAILALASFSYYFIEQPVRVWRPTSHRAVFNAVLPVTGLAMFWLYLLRGPLAGELHSGGVLGSTEMGDVGFVDYQRCAEASNCSIIGSGATLSVGGGAQLGNLGQAKQCSCRAADPTLHSPPLSAGLANDPPCFSEQGVAPLAHDIWDGFKWDSGVDPAKRLEPDRGADGKKPAVFLIGDSHAVHMRWALMPDCAPLGDHAFYMYTGFVNGWEDEQFNSFLDRVLVAGDVVVLSYQFEHYHNESFRNPRATWVRNMSKLAQDRKAAIMLFGDVPRKTTYHKSPTAKGPECVPTASRPNVSAACEMSKEEVEREFAPMYQMWQDLSKQSNVFFFNYYQLLCSATTCNAMIPGTSTLAYMDENHITKGASLYLRPYMCAAMAKALTVIA